MEIRELLLFCFVVTVLFEFLRPRRSPENNKCQRHNRRNSWSRVYCYADDHHHHHHQAAKRWLMYFFLPWAQAVTPGIDMVDANGGCHGYNSIRNASAVCIYKARTLCHLITVDVCICDNATPTIPGVGIDRNVMWFVEKSRSSPANQNECMGEQPGKKLVES